MCYVSSLLCDLKLSKSFAYCRDLNKIQVLPIIKNVLLKYIFKAYIATHIN